jgi:hypothetical protein
MPVKTRLLVRYVIQASLKRLLDSEFGAGAYSIKVTLVFTTWFFQHLDAVPRSNADRDLVIQVAGDYIEITASRILTQVRLSSGFTVRHFGTNNPCSARGSIGHLARVDS